MPYFVGALVVDLVIVDLGLSSGLARPGLFVEGGHKVEGKSPSCIQRSLPRRLEVYA
jgi:hypothetical protein